MKIKSFLLATLLVSASAIAGLSNPGNTQIPAVGTSYTPPAGFLGQSISSVISNGSAVALTTVTPANITSISLTPGNWLVFGLCAYLATSTTTISYTACSISNTSATLIGGQTTLQTTPGGSTALNTGQSASTQLVQLASTTTYYLVAQSSFAGSTLSGYGSIFAIRLF